MAGKIEELFSFDCNGLFWDSAFDPATGFLLLQVRNEEKHETTFSLIDLRRGHWVIRNRQFDESWWIGISAFSTHRAILHIYEDDQNPELKSLLLWDTEKDLLLNTYENTTFSKLLEGGFLVRRDDDFHTMNWQGKEVSGLLEIKQSVTDNTLIHYPFQYQAEDSDFATIKSFITQSINVLPEAGAEYLETEKHLFISYYIREDKMLANYLLISDLDGEVLLNQNINTSAKGIGRDTFFIFERKLIFISNNNRLFVYAI